MGCGASGASLHNFNIWFIGFGCLVIVLFRSHTAILLSGEGLVSIMFWVSVLGFEWVKSYWGQVSTIDIWFVLVGCLVLGSWCFELRALGGTSLHSSIDLFRWLFREGTGVKSSQLTFGSLVLAVSSLFFSGHIPPFFFRWRGSSRLCSGLSVLGFLVLSALCFVLGFWLCGLLV